MVQEVEGGKSEFDVLLLCDLESLEERKVAIEPGGAVDIRQLPGPVGVRSWTTEAPGVEVLVRLQVRGWIAYNRRHESGTWRTQEISAAEAVVASPGGKSRIREPRWPGSVQAQVDAA